MSYSTTTNDPYAFRPGKELRRLAAEERQARPTVILMECGHRTALPSEIHYERAHPVSA